MLASDAGRSASDAGRSTICPIELSLVPRESVSSWDYFGVGAPVARPNRVPLVMILLGAGDLPLHPPTIQEANLGVFKVFLLGRGTSTMTLAFVMLWPTPP